MTDQMSDQIVMREISTRPNLTALFGKAALAGIRPGGGGQRGKTLPTFGYSRSGVKVDRANLADYDRVCGYGLTDRLPAMYPHLLTFGMQIMLMNDDAFPFAMIGLVHVANNITQLRPIRAEETLELRVHPENLRPHDKGKQFDMVSTAHVNGELVWSEVSTYLRRGGGSGGSGDAKPAGEQRVVEPVERPDSVWRVPGDIGRQYADVSGDRNPIHLYPLTAKLFGFPKAIAHGMWSAARCLAFFESRLPDSFVYDVRFKLPILLPATVALSTASTEGGVKFELTARRSGKPHLDGSIISP
jgi:acyl dehydratase